MKLIYIISLGHSGSTLLDSILGTHPDIISSGELFYLNWQIARTINNKSTVENQDICSCLKDFRDCNFWSKVIKSIKLKTGCDIISNPKSFDTSLFNRFSFNDRGGYKQGKINQYFQKISKELLISGNYPLNMVYLIYPRLRKQLKNKWILYQTMSEVGNKSCIVDSSKDITEALLLKQYKPNYVIILFLHRNIEGLAASSKRLAKLNDKSFNIQQVIERKILFEKRVLRIKNNLQKTDWVDAKYENIVNQPASFLDDIASKLCISSNYQRQQNDHFYIDTSKLHLVAGNPMRYKGIQKVTNDRGFKKELTDQELTQLKI